MHISMKGPAKELPKGDDGSYGTSITYEQAMDPAMDVLVAWEQNGRRLDPDHGYPVRMIIPGYIGGRMIKWLAEITVGEKESDNFYHYKDNRLLPVQVDVERADREGWWFKPGCVCASYFSCCSCCSYCPSLCFHPPMHYKSARTDSPSP
jgi:DMSO/TMAO reductase YedYZ molybdopterin-dependent catalytic subunit